MNAESQIEAGSSTHSISAGELLQIVETLESIEAEKKDAADRFKEYMNEAGSRGFDKKTLRKLLALRKKSRDERSEEEAMLDLYMQVLGMT